MWSPLRQPGGDVGKWRRGTAREIRTLMRTGYTGVKDTVGKYVAQVGTKCVLVVAFGVGEGSFAETLKQSCSFLDFDK